MEEIVAWNIEVYDKETFIRFLKLLQADFVRHGHNEQRWENNRLDLFLEAMSVYSRDIEGYYRNVEPGQDAHDPSWKLFADIMRGSAVYE
jgi:hypothetical protein